MRTLLLASTILLSASSALAQETPSNILTPERVFSSPSLMSDTTESTPRDDAESVGTSETSADRSPIVVDPAAVDLASGAVADGAVVDSVSRATRSHHPPLAGAALPMPMLLFHRT